MMRDLFDIIEEAPISKILTEIEGQEPGAAIWEIIRKGGKGFGRCGSGSRQTIFGFGIEGSGMTRKEAAAWVAAAKAKIS